VIEVGMGGRLDATNVLTPLCTIITDIDYDHTQYLGSTLKEIALEKAAVIKRQGNVVTSVTDPDILTTLRTICQKQEAALYSTEHECTVRSRAMTSEGSIVDIRTPFHSYRGLRIALPGKHQLRNASAAVLALDLLGNNGLKLRQKNVREGVANTVWPGRLQVLQRDPLFIVDGAHNPAGIIALKEALIELFSYESLILILGVMADKQFTDMIRTIVPLAGRTIVTKPKMDRALDEQLLAREVHKVSTAVETAPSVSKAVKRALELAGPGDAVCAAGSLFLVGEILKERFGQADALFGLN
jgi:dihydrofolate synthase/folylpolyglutamate synthase